MVGTATSSEWTLFHGARGTPSLQLLLEETPSLLVTTSVVTHVGFNNSLTVNETAMPTGMGGATSGDAGASSNPRKSQDKIASKGGARPKVDAGRGGKHSDPHRDEQPSRESSPTGARQLRTPENAMLCFSEPRLRCCQNRVRELSSFRRTPGLSKL